MHVLKIKTVYHYHTFDFFSLARLCFESPTSPTVDVSPSATADPLAAAMRLATAGATQVWTHTCHTWSECEHDKTCTLHRQIHTHTHTHTHGRIREISGTKRYDMSDQVLCVQDGNGCRTRCGAGVCSVYVYVCNLGIFTAILTPVPVAALRASAARRRRCFSKNSALAASSASLRSSSRDSAWA